MDLKESLSLNKERRMAGLSAEELWNEKSMMRKGMPRDSPLAPRDKNLCIRRILDAKKEETHVKRVDGSSRYLGQKKKLPLN